MDSSLIITLIITAFSLIVYYVFFSASIFDFFENLFPEIIGIFVTYRIIEYLISRRKKGEDERRLNNLYQQIRREIMHLISNLQELVKIDIIDEVFYSGVKSNLKIVNVVYPLLIAGNALFSEYFYATLFRVIRDIERNMDLILDIYPDENMPALLENELKDIIRSHDELANLIMHCEYEENPPKYELFQARARHHTAGSRCLPQESQRWARELPRDTSCRL